MAEKSKVFNFTNTFFNIGMMIIHYAPGFCIYREEVKLCISCVPGICNRTPGRIERTGWRRNGARRPDAAKPHFCRFGGKTKPAGFAGRRPAFGRGSPEVAALSAAYDLRSFRRNKLSLRTKSFIEQKKETRDRFWTQASLLYRLSFISRFAVFFVMIQRFWHKPQIPKCRMPPKRNGYKLLSRSYPNQFLAMSCRLTDPWTALPNRITTKPKEIRCRLTGLPLSMRQLSLLFFCRKPEREWQKQFPPLSPSKQK